jgi:hypothetical protein
MPINNTSRTAGPFIGNGVTKDFPFNYKVFTRQDVLVAVTNTTTGAESILTLDSDYSVTLNSNQDLNPGGVITTTVAPAVGTSLAATSNIAITQNLDLTNQGGFYPKAISDALDRMVIQIQQVAARVGLGLNVGAAATIAAVLEFTQNLKLSTGSSLVGFIQSGVGAVLRTVQDKLRDVPRSVRDFGAKGDGVTDDTQAFQKAFDASNVVYIPGGDYKINGTIAKITTKSFRVYGDGIGVTNILQYADADLFYVGNAGGGSGQFTVEHMSLRPRAAMTAGAALSFRNDTVLPSLIVSHVYIGSESTYEFKYGIKCHNCMETLFHRVVQYGLGTANFIPWYLTSSTAATTPKWSYCAVYNARYGVQIVNTVSPGIEGAQFYGCDFVAVSTGVLFQNPYGPTYLPPQLAWFGGHINATIRNFDVANMSQLVIQGALLYNSGTGPFINVNTCSDLLVVGNKFITIGAGNAIGMDIYTLADPINGGFIGMNSFSVNAGVPCININASRIIQNLKIAGNQRITGSKTVNVFGGYIPNSVEIVNNTQDSEDIYDTITVTGSTTGLGGTRANFFLINASPNATITQLIGRRPSETITLKSDDATLKLKHNGIANGFILKGSVDFSFGPGANITLTKANGSIWYETARSV